MEALVELYGLRDRQAVAEDEGLRPRVAAVGLPVLDHALAPDEGIARVVPDAVEELAEEHVEVAQEGIHPVDVGECDAEVAPVLLGPHLEGEDLRVAQPWAQRLAGLQELVGHRAVGREAELLGVHDVRRASEDAAETLLHVEENLLLPGLGEAAPRTVVRDPQPAVVGLVAQKLDLALKACDPLRLVKIWIRVPEVDLVDDRKHGNLKEDRVQPRALRGDVDAAGIVLRLRHGDVLALQMEEAQKLDVVRLDEAQAVEVGELVLPEVEAAEMVELGVDLVDEGRKIDAGRAALEAVFGVGPRELVQHALLHREFVEVRVEQ